MTSVCLLWLRYSSATSCCCLSYLSILDESIFDKITLQFNDRVLTFKKFVFPRTEARSWLYNLLSTCPNQFFECKYLSVSFRPHAKFKKIPLKLESYQSLFRESSNQANLIKIFTDLKLLSKEITDNETVMNFLNQWCFWPFTLVNFAIFNFNFQR